MKKGASTAIVMILIMLITISLILMTYQWLLKYSPQTQQNLQNSLQQNGGCLSIENINTNSKQITVRNCGDMSLSNFIVYLDSGPIATYSGTLSPGSITQISYNSNINSGNHEIFVSSDYAETNKIVFSIPSFLVGPLYFFNSVNSTSAGTPVMHRLYWQSGVGLSGYIFQFCNGTWTGSSCGGGTQTILSQIIANSTTNAKSYVGNNAGLPPTSLTSFTALSEFSSSQYTAVGAQDGNEISYSNPNLNGYSIFKHNFTIPTNTGINWIYIYIYGWGENPTEYMTTYLWNYTGGNWAKVYNATNTGRDNYKAFGTNITGNFSNWINNNIINILWEENTLYSDAGEDYVYINVSYNTSSGWVNDTWQPMTGTTSWSNVTKTVNSTTGATIAWCVYANDTSSNWNGTSCVNPFVYVTSAVSPFCQVFINFLPYNITQNNTYYCLNTSSVNLTKTAIQFGSSSSWTIQNSTLDCQGYKLDGNDTSNTNGVYLTGSSTNNNAIKNCNITDFYYGIYLYNGPNNNTLTNNTANSNYDGFYLQGSSNNSLSNNKANSNGDDGLNLEGSSNNTLTNNTANSNGDGIEMASCYNNTLLKNTFNVNSDGMYIFSSSYNTIANSTADGNMQDGIMLIQGSNNNILSNNDFSTSITRAGVYFSDSSNNTLYNTKAVGNIYGIYVYYVSSGSYYNNITVGDIGLNNEDYYLSGAGTTNTFSQTFYLSIARTIYFADSNSWFNYNNPTFTSSNIWLNTNVSAAATISRYFVNWNQTLMQWNDTASTSITARYNITGLLTNTNYSVYNNSVLIPGSPFNSGSSGQISFTINLPANQGCNIMIAASTFNGILWFKFNESNGTKVYDSSGNGFTGNFQGETFNDGFLGFSTGTDPSDPTRVSNGKYGNALKFDGINDSVSIPGILPLNNIFTVELWFNTSSNGTLISEQDNPYPNMPESGNWDPLLYVENNSKLHGGINTPNGQPTLESSYAVNDNKWHYAALVVNGTNQSLYVDGNLNGSFIGTPEGPWNNYLYIGSGFTEYWPNASNSWFFFNGTIDEVRIYNRSLSKSEIQADMQSSLPMSRTLASYRFEESGQYVNDTHIWVNGTYGSALSFDGKNDYVNLSANFSAMLNSNNVFTAGLWFKTSSYGTLISEQDNQYPNSNPSYYDPFLYVENKSGNNKLHGGICCPQPTLESSYAVNDSNWHYAALVVNGNTQSLYVDGNLNGSFSGITEGPFYYLDIGAGYTYSWPNTNNSWFFFNGTIDEVKIWNRTLTQAEIQTAMNTP